MGEASSNLARFDGVRYGYSVNEPTNIDELYCKTRGEGFGDEVKRRIMVGSYLLSGENADIYYTKALQINPKMTDAYYNRAQITLTRKDNKTPDLNQIIEDLNKALELDPKFIDALFAMAATLKKQEKYLMTLRLQLQQP
jgi:Asp-tRNA(Asn)/Glu-tRNA(Gln) amidotransferase A subunit family amidase